MSILNNSTCLTFEDCVSLFAFRMCERNVNSQRWNSTRLTFDIWRLCFTLCLPAEQDVHQANQHRHPCVRPDQEVNVCQHSNQMCFFLFCPSFKEMVDGRRTLWETWCVSSTRIPMLFFSVGSFSSFPAAVAVAQAAAVAVVDRKTLLPRHRLQHRNVYCGGGWYAKAGTFPFRKFWLNSHLESFDSKIWTMSPCYAPQSSQADLNHFQLRNGNKISLSSQSPRQLTLSQVIAVDADPRNLAYLR